MKACGCMDFLIYCICGDQVITPIPIPIAVNNGTWDVELKWSMEKRPLSYTHKYGRQTPGHACIISTTYACALPDLSTRDPDIYPANIYAHDVY